MYMVSTWVYKEVLFTVKHPRPEHTAAVIALSICFRTIVSICFDRLFLARVTSMSDSNKSNQLAAKALKDCLAAILDEIRQSERRMEQRLKQLESDV